MFRRICVFCGANRGARPRYATVTAEVARYLAARGIGLVYGGGNVGLMGVLADAALDAGVPVTGVIPHFLERKEVAHAGVDLRLVDSMHQRKALMAELSDAFLALPGGYGTLDEFCEILSWAQLGLHRKPCGVLNVDGFFDPFLAMLDHAVAEGFLKPDHRALVLAAESIEGIMDQFASYRPPAVEKWIRTEQT
jgi:uncharacterized protein (TIGR00730 family)